MSATWARDHGDPLCGEHADELKAYIEAYTAAKISPVLPTNGRGS